MQDEAAGTQLVEWVAATGALLPVLVGLIALAVTFWRRPNLTLHALREHWHVEAAPDRSPLPFVRLVARNGRLHRSSHGTRVLVEHVRWASDEQRKVHLGSPPLGWTSAADSVDASVVIFPGGERTVDVGAFESWLSDDGKSHEWCLRIVPYLDIHEGRNRFLAREGGYIVRVVIGSNDGRARRYDVRVTWDAFKRLAQRDEWGGLDMAWNADELLASVECEAKRVRRDSQRHGKGARLRAPFRRFVGTG